MKCFLILIHRIISLGKFKEIINWNLKLLKSFLFQFMNFMHDYIYQILHRNTKRPANFITLDHSSKKKITVLCPIKKQSCVQLFDNQWPNLSSQKKRKGKGKANKKKKCFFLASLWHILTRKIIAIYAGDCTLLLPLFLCVYFFSFHSEASRVASETEWRGNARKSTFSWFQTVNMVQ